MSKLIINVQKSRALNKMKPYNYYKYWVFINRKTKHKQIKTESKIGLFKNV